MAWAQPTHTTHITHTWGEVQLRRAAWDFRYVRSPTFVAWEMRNDRFTILELVLPFANKWWVTHYPRVTKKKKENKQGCSYKLTQQTTKGYSLCGVHPGFLPQTSSGDLFLLSSSLLSLPFLVRLLPQVDLRVFLYHYLYLFSIVPACSIPGGYMNE